MLKGTEYNGRTCRRVDRGHRIEQGSGVQGSVLYLIYRFVNCRACRQ